MYSLFYNLFYILFSARSKLAESDKKQKKFVNKVSSHNFEILESLKSGDICLSDLSLETFKNVWVCYESVREVSCGVKAKLYFFLV